MTVALAKAEPIMGAGSTFAFPLLSQWAEHFRTAEADGDDFPSPDGGLDYEPVGSLAGTMRVIAGAVDFAASDVPLDGGDLDRHRLMQFPVAMGGIAVVANLPAALPGSGGHSLRLSGAVLADIYLGTITSWSHPALKTLNPDLSLPDGPITVVHRSEGSGTTYNFAAYLARASTPWRKRVGVDTELRWPTGTGVRGSQGIVEAVKATPGAIGYVEAGQAARAGLAMAEMANRAGRFVAPSHRTVETAATSADWSRSPHFTLLLAEAADPDAYPVAATVFALMPRDRIDSGRGRRVLRFFDGALTLWQQDAADLGYVPLPAPLVALVRASWNSAPPAR
ncbi:phosphate ABC transporter substrate-binding protein PstS [Azospirillum sp. YIM B02556]|uniref:Phosphate-binding protein PstS n=1 Tax=Azospirillum endophyticum TaxID=2800326 RepID=A0ABS1F193_9PROT|nr:phosphate ABC transporter substrate-binding protein PstS [Azospirillum endophyticum]MBK1837186.1 phosphate ABC transporter substrate-binding protein PstS [Azospirillum endophyticum]